MARPVEYNETVVKLAEEYISQCVDDIEEYHKTRGEKSDTYERLVRVKMPTLEGLAVHLGIARKTIYNWADTYPEFLHVIEKLQAIQADRLLNNGLSGDYNPTIAKVLLTKHGYREGTDVTTDGSKLPTPIINVLSNDSNQEGNGVEEKN